MSSLQSLSTHPVSGGKGDTLHKTRKSQQPNLLTHFIRRLQLTTLHSNKLDFLTKQLEDGVTNPQGYSPQTLASMRTQATEQAALNNAKVMQAVNEKNATEGGASATALPNGVQEQIAAGVGTGVANQEANAQLGITQQEGQLEAENRNRDIAALEGVAQTENPEAMAGEGNNAASTVGSLSQAVTAANGPGIGSILGSVVGAGVGAFASGGLSTLMKKWNNYGRQVTAMTEGTQPSTPQVTATNEGAAPSQAAPAAPAPSSRLGAILQSVAKVASVGMQGIPDKGRPSFATGLGEGARARKCRLQVQIFDDQVRLAQLHNQDLKMQQDTAGTA
jgi:hypothetical protein